MARKTPQANASMKQGKWERSKFTGAELYEKTLAIFGLGRIGSLVAERARGFGMKLIGYDPYISEERAAEMGVDALRERRRASCRMADFITVHLPKTKETIGMFGAEQFAKMKDGVRLVNTARGGIYQIDALADALEQRQGRRRRHRRLRGRAVHRLAAHRVRQRHPHAAPRRVHRGGAGPRRRADRRVRRRWASRASMVPTAVNIAPVSPEVMEKVGPYIDLAEDLGTHARADRARRRRRARHPDRRRARRRRHAHPAHGRAQGPAHACRATRPSTS